MKRHIPNCITCLNLLSGCISIVMAFKGELQLASYMILLAALFDFCDGLVARLLKVESPIGVDLDSFADNLSFGLAPAMILFVWLKDCYADLSPSMQTPFTEILRYLVFIVPILSAVRLAKFNHDERQKTEFRGLATPANALFIGFLHFASENISFLGNYWIALIGMFIFSLLMVIDLPMFSLKFKNFKFKENWFRFLFLFLALLLLIFFQIGAIPVIILLYLFMTLMHYIVVRIHIK